MNKITNGKIEINAGRVAVYIVIALIGLWFFSYYDNAFSLAFIIALVFAAIASCGATYFASAEIYTNVELSRSIADKGEEIHMTLTIESRRHIPVPFFYVKVSNEWLLAGRDGEQYVISVSAAHPAVITQSCKALVWGTASLGVSEIAIHDFLGLFRITYTGRCHMPAASVSIRPALRESLRNDYLALVCNRMVDEEKEDGQSAKRSFLSQPGYQHRPYVPGDPLKLVNWKLSARVDKYMVRENEFLKTHVPVIVLDRFGIRQMVPPEHMHSAALLEERIVEAVLAMLDSMVKQSVSCKIFYYGNDAWQELTVEEKDQIMDLQQIFSQYVFESTGGPRIPEGIVAEGSTIAVFTCAFDYALQSEITKALGSGTVIDVICPETHETDLDNLWIVNESYDFYK